MRKIFSLLKSILSFNYMIKINNTTYQSGKNLSIKNGRIFVDGTDVTPIAEKFEITVSGDVETINFDYVKAINVTGNVGTLNAGMGDVNVSGDVSNGVSASQGDIDIKGNVEGKVKASQGDIKANNITGDAETSMGDITASSIEGNAKTSMGDINKAFKK